MKQVHKFPLRYANGYHQVVKMPAEARVAHVAHQLNIITLWAVVDPQAPILDRYFHIVETGGDVHPSWVYVGTVLVDQYVYHIFEEVRS